MIGGCIRNDLNAHELLYRNFYGFAMGICLRYSSSRLDARGIVNAGFLKVFNSLDKFDQSKPFIPWLGKIMSNTAIDYYRSEIRNMSLLDLSDAEEIYENAAIEQKLQYDELLGLVQQLPPAYRTVFNLYVIDGYTHEEIAQKLKITVGGSKSNLFKARRSLRELLKKMSMEENKVISMNSYPFVKLSK